MNINLTRPVSKITFFQGTEKLESQAISFDFSEDSTILFFGEFSSTQFIGSQYHVFEFIVALCQLGYQVVLLTNIRPIVLNAFISYDLHNLTILITQSGSPSLSIFQPHIKFKYVIGTSLSSIESLAAYKRKWKSQIKYLQPIFVVPPLASKYRKGNDLNTNTPAFQRIIQDLAFTDAIITQTVLNKIWIQKWINYPESKIWVIPPAVNTKVADKYLTSDRKNRIVYIGRGVDYKNLFLLPEILSQSNFSGELYVLGPKISFSSDKFKVINIPNCSEEEKFKILSQSKLLIFPSEWEDFGMPPMEAGYYGIPTILKDLPSYREVFSSYPIYVNSSNPTDFAKQINLFWDKFALNFQFFITHNYTFSNMISKFKSYFQVLSSNIKTIQTFPTIIKSKSLHIGVIKAGGIGDTIEGLILIKKIKSTWPTATISFCVRDKVQTELVKLFPDLVDNSISIFPYSWPGYVKENFKNYDLFYDLRYIPRIYNNLDEAEEKLYSEKFLPLLPYYQSWNKAAEYVLKQKKLRIQVTSELLGYSLSSSDFLLTPQGILKFKPGFSLPDKYITFHHGADGGYQTKTWVDNRWNKVIEFVKSKGYYTIQLGIPSESKLQTDLDLRGKTDFLTLFYLLKFSTLHFDTEGGLVHLAHTQGTKSVVLFGPTPISAYGYSENLNLQINSCEYQPCWWKFSNWNWQCPKCGSSGYPVCMEKISSDLVISSIRNLL